MGGVQGAFIPFSNPGQWSLCIPNPLMRIEKSERLRRLNMYPSFLGCVPSKNVTYSNKFKNLRAKAARFG